MEPLEFHNGCRAGAVIATAAAVHCSRSGDEHRRIAVATGCFKAMGRYSLFEVHMKMRGVEEMASLFRVAVCVIDLIKSRQECIRIRNVARPLHEECIHQPIKLTFLMGEPDPFVEIAAAPTALSLRRGGEEKALR
jgi:hypothetical protein